MRFRLFILFIILLNVLIQGCSTNNKKEYQLTTSVNPSEAGAVSPEEGSFNDGVSLEITATPNEYWVFDRWQGDLTGTANPSTLIVNKNLDITAMFRERTYPLNLEILGEGTVSEQIIQQKANEYPNGTLVELSANPADGWYFLEWDGDLEGAEPQKEVMISAETNITAKFATDRVKTFGGSGWEYANSVYYTNDGGLILAGRSTSNDGDFEGLAPDESFAFVLKLSASGDKEWIRTFFGSDHAEDARSVVQSHDGGYLVTGSTYPDDSGSDNFGQGEIFVIKLNSAGDMEWSRIIGGSNSDFAQQILEMNDGSVVVAGHSASWDGDFENLSLGYSDGFLIKLSAEGNIEWLKTYGGSDTDYFSSLDSTLDGGFIVSGDSELSDDNHFEGLDPGRYFAFVMKMNADGDVQWTKTFNGNGPDYAGAVISSAHGGTIVTGTTYSSDGDFQGLNNGFTKPFVIKLDASGQKEWTTVYEADYSFIRTSSLVETTTNDIVVTGISNPDAEPFDPFGKIYAQIIVLKLNSSGSFKWFKTFGGSEDNFGRSITKTDDSSLIIAGNSDSVDGIFTNLNRGESDIYVIKLNEWGELIPFE